MSVQLDRNLLLVYRYVEPVQSAKLVASVPDAIFRAVRGQKFFVYDSNNAIFLVFRACPGKHLVALHPLSVFLVFVEQVWCKLYEKINSDFAVLLPHRQEILLGVWGLLKHI